MGKIFPDNPRPFQFEWLFPFLSERQNAMNFESKRRPSGAGLTALWVFFLGAALFHLSFAPPAVARDTNKPAPPKLEAIKIMKISAADKTAVIKMPDSRLQLIKVNQWFWDEKAIVRRIGKNEIVIKSLLGPVPETFIFRKVGDKQTLQRYQTILPSQEGGVLFAPAPAQPIEK